jgi:hypothetical protein
MTARRAAALAMAALLLAPACRMNGLAFRQDQRVKITAPAERADVRLPVRMSWSIRHFTPAPADGSRSNDRGSFGIFVDRAPQPPGETFAWFFRRLPGCRHIADCLTGDRLEALGIYQTTHTTFDLAAVGRRAGAPRGEEDFHEVDVVLLDGSGRRIGESGDTVEFNLIRPKQQSS